MAVLKMAQQGIPNNNATTLSSQQQKQQPEKQKLEEQQLGKHTIFHDFLGMKPGDSPVLLPAKASTDCRLSDPSPSASASLGASSGGGRGPVSTTSDLGSGEFVPIW